MTFAGLQEFLALPTRIDQLAPDIILGILQHPLMVIANLFWPSPTRLTFSTKCTHVDQINNSVKLATFNDLC
jgi:hypothetical protein